ncbi:MAG TPA: hypothetical protein VFD58_11510 [Blastocatellia bacterium]|nr:hypothetical protein [Blastocatellia bacterium]
MGHPEWNISRDGRSWTEEELSFFHEKGPEKPEIIEGKLFWTEEDRLNVLALLLINVGMDQAVRLGPAKLWQEAVEKRLHHESKPE